MNLTVVISSLGPGGAERAASIMANHWAEKGWRITIVTYENPSAIPFYAMSENVRFRRLGLAGASHSRWEAVHRNRTRMAAVRDAVRVTGPQCVLTFGDTTNISTIIACAGLRVPVIVSERIVPYAIDMPREWLILRRLAYPLAAAVVVQTDRIAEYFGSWRLARLVIIPNVIMPPAGLSNIDAPLVNGAGVKIVSMGRLVEQKRFDLLLRAFARVSQYRRCALTIIGNGPLRPTLEELARTLGISDRVAFTGLVKNPLEFLAQADIFVLSSAFEGMPNALMEAMAAGLAVISFDCPTGPRELIRDGVDGILVPPLDVAGLADAMRRLISDPAERKRLAGRAIEVRERFSIEKVMGMWEDLLSKVCAGRP